MVFCTLVAELSTVFLHISNFAKASKPIHSHSKSVVEVFYRFFAELS
jgi:hypothetical protein